MRSTSVQIIDGRLTGEPLRRVTRARPCPVCGRPDWCSVTVDGTLAICMRVPEGAKKRSANGGFVHVLRDDQGWRSRPHARVIRAAAREPQRTDLDELARQYREAVDGAALQALAESLGLTTKSVGRLRLGWDARRGAWAFPMVDHAGYVLGIRLRFPDGRKLSVRGGREGLFIPDGLTYAGPLLLAEGPTDCAALLDLGFEAVGRPSCTGGTAHCVDLVRAHWPLDVIVVADGDPPGERGAAALAFTLLVYARTVRVIRPPDGMKDIRMWKRAGATAADLRKVVGNTPTRRLRIGVTCHD